MRRKLVIVPLALLILGIGGSLAYWHFVIGQLESGLNAWIAERRGQGWTVRLGSIGRGGWSPTASLTVHDVDIAARSPVLGDPVAWHASRVELRVDLFDPTRLNIHPQGLQVIRLPDGTAVSVVAEALNVSLTGAGPGGATIDIDATDIRAEATEAGMDLGAIATLDAQIVLRPDAAAAEQTATFTLACKDIRLTDHIRWPLGPRIEAITAEGGITGKPQEAVSPRAAAAAWRDAGGAVEVTVHSLIWGPLNATASATLALDDDLQPMGAGTAHVTGFQGTFDALGSNGIMTSSAVKAAKALLSLMAGVPGGREQQSVDVPLTLQYRTLSMRQIPLLLLPELDWPGP